MNEWYGSYYLHWLIWLLSRDGLIGCSRERISLLIFCLRLHLYFCLLLNTANESLILTNSHTYSFFSHFLRAVIARGMATEKQSKLS